jgi:thioredoxin-related protein
VIQNILNQQFVPVQIVEDSKVTYTVQGKTYTAQDLMVEYKVSGFPTLAFLEPDGKLIGLVPGYVKPDEFQLLLTFISSKAYLNTDFDTYSKTAK